MIIRAEFIQLKCYKIYEDLKFLKYTTKQNDNKEFPVAKNTIYKLGLRPS